MVRSGWLKFGRQSNHGLIDQDWPATKSFKASASKICWFANRV